MKRILRWSLAVLAFLALLIITAAGVLLSLDYDAIKSDLAARAGAYIGRPLAVDGRLAIKPGRTLRLTAEGLRLGNAAWGSRPDMLHAARVLIEVDAWSLIDRPVIVHRVDVDGFDLLLERTPRGDQNWDFGGADTDFAWMENLPVIVQEIAMPDARVTFIGPRLDRPLDVRLDTFEQHRSADGFLALVASGKANDVGISLRARAGPFDKLVAGRDFELSLDGELGEVRMTGSAQVDSLANPVDTNVNLRVQAPDAEYLASRLGVRNLGYGPVALSVVISPAAAGRGVQGAVSGQLGAFEVDARGELADPVALEKLAVQLDVAGPDLSVLGGLIGMNALPAETFRLQAAVERSGQFLEIDQFDLDLRDSRLRLQGSIDRASDLGGANVEFSFKGNDVARFRQLLNIPGVATGPFDLSGRARRGDGGADTLDLQATTALGKFSLSGPLGPYPDYYGSRLRFSASGPDLARIGSALGIANLPATAFTSRGQMVWTSKGVTLNNSFLSAGPDRLTLDGRIARDPLGPGTDVRFAASGRDLRRLASVLGIDNAPPGAYDLKGRLRRERGASRLNDLQGTVAGARLRLSGRIGDQPLRDGTSVSLRVSGPELEAFAGLVPEQELPSGPFSAEGGLELTPAKAVLRELRIRAAGAEAELDADISLPFSQATGTFDIDAQGPDLARFLPASGTAKGAFAQPFKLQAAGAARNGRWRFDRMQLTAGTGRISLAGELDWSPDFSATSLKLDVDLPDLALIGPVVGLELPAQPLKLAATFSGTRTAFEMQQVTGELGPTDFTGRFSLALGGKPRLDVDIRSRLLDLTSLSGNAAASPASPAPPPKTRSQRVIPDTPLPLQWLDKVDGTFAVAAARARIADSGFRDVRLNARMQDGSLFVDPLELQGPSAGTLVLKAEIDPDPRGFAARLSGTARQIVLSPWTDTPAQAATRPRADLDLQLSGQGRTWRELAAGIEGKLRLVGGAGDTPTAGLDKLLGGLWSSLVQKVGGKSAASSMRLRCLALVANATGGIVVTAPLLAFQTDKVNIISHGRVNLRDETVEFYLRTTPRDRLSMSAGEIINPYVRIVGPMSNPGLGVDPKGTLFTAGTAFATGGISIIAQSLWGRMFRAGDPCAAALAEADKLVTKPTTNWPSWLPKPFQ